MRMLVLLMALSYATASVAIADPYWVAYEGDDFPENEGWTRIHDPPGAERQIEESVFSLDTRNDVWITDYYEMYRPGALDPEPGELFVWQWRLRIVELTHAFFDPSVGVFSDERRGLGFEFNEDTIFSAYEPGVSATFEPGVFHDFRLRSWDMRTYELYIDDELSIAGSFLGQMDASRVVWGDGVKSIGSLTEWDYFRFGVVHEPSSVVLVLVLVCGTLRSCIRASRPGVLRPSAPYR